MRTFAATRLAGPVFPSGNNELLRDPAHPRRTAHGARRTAHGARRTMHGTLVAARLSGHAATNARFAGDSRTMMSVARAERFVVHLVDGTYELFRHHYALPDHKNAAGEEVAATRAVVGSMLRLVQEGATHVGVATDHTVESFRNDLYEGYKTGEGIDPELLAQFPLLEDALRAAGFVVWPMVRYEADDALATAAAQAARDPRVEQVRICTPDKDLGQSVQGTRVVQFDRRKDVVLDEAAIVEKFGVPPSSIADYLALVGDSADGFPGLPGWGAKSASTVLARWGSIEAIPADHAAWDVTVRGAVRLAASLQEGRDLAMLFRHIATVVTDVDLETTVDDLRWQGPTAELDDIAQRLDAPRLLEQAAGLAARRA